MLANFLIGLREGLEASLVVGILVAYLMRSGNRAALGRLWTGVGLAVLLSLALGALLSFTSTGILSSGASREAFDGVTSLLAVALVTAMVFWMRRAARSIKGELHGRLDTALALGGTAVAATGFFTVGREGLETALFLFSAVQATGQTAVPLTGALLGLSVAVLLGWLIYRRAIALNLSRFFTVTGALLIVVAAGVAAYGVRDLQEAGWLPGLTTIAYDVSAQVPPGSWYGTLLKGVLNLSPVATVAETATYLGYLLPLMVLFFRPGSAPTRPARTAEPRPIRQPAA
ncbi:MAG: iron uptake transporter permease EfeU [Mycobacteriales bacterium]